MLSYVKSQQTMAPRPNPAHSLLLYSSETKIGFHIVKWLKKIKIVIFIDTWKLYEIQMSMSKTKFYWNLATLIHLCIVHKCFPATLAELLTTGIVWPAKPKIFTI